MPETLDLFEEKMTEMEMMWGGEPSKKINRNQRQIKGEVPLAHYAVPATSKTGSEAAVKTQQANGSVECAPQSHKLLAALSRRAAGSRLRLRGRHLNVFLFNLRSQRAWEVIVGAGSQAAVFISRLHSGRRCATLKGGGWWGEAGGSACCCVARSQNARRVPHAGEIYGPL